MTIRKNVHDYDRNGNVLSSNNISNIHVKMFIRHGFIVALDTDTNTEVSRYTLAEFKNFINQSMLQNRSVEEIPNIPLAQ
jgi:hypothetical protein